MRKKYKPLTCKKLECQYEKAILAGSVQIETVEKEFIVKTGEYELEDDTWYGNKQSFDFE